MRKLINRLKELFLYCDYMEFNRVLTNEERDNITAYVNGKKYMSKYPPKRKGYNVDFDGATATITPIKKGKPAGVIGSQGSFVI